MTFAPTATVLIPLICGSTVALSTCCISLHLLYKHGLRFDIYTNRHRQTLIGLVCLLASINGLIQFPVSATSASIAVMNANAIISFAVVAFGLVLINHNSIVRVHSLMQSTSRMGGTLVRDRICTLLYVLPLVTLIPIYLAAADQVPKTNGLLNNSDYNKIIYKPLGLTLILSTEFLATATDLAVFFHVTQLREKKSRKSVSATAEQSLVKAFADYSWIWGLVVVDVTIKVLIIKGYPLFFDNIVSMLTICFRAKTNLDYGLHLRQLLGVTTSAKASAGLPHSNS